MPIIKLLEMVILIYLTIFELLTIAGSNHFARINKIMILLMPDTKSIVC